MKRTLLSPFGQELLVASMPSVLGGDAPCCRGTRGWSKCLTLDGFKQEKKKKEDNVGPPNKLRTCAATAEAARVSDFHAVWEVPHPPCVWNISALRGLNLTPALSSLPPLPAEPAPRLSLAQTHQKGSSWGKHMGLVA